jgi:O-antigen ligase
LNQLIELKRWFTYFLIFFIYAKGCDNFTNAKKIIFFIALGYSFECLHAFKDLVLIGRSRLWGSLGNPNELGAYLGSFWILPWLASRSLTNQPWAKFFFKGSLFIGIICTTFTLSRASFLTLAATFLIFFFFKSKRIFILGICCLFLTIIFYQTVLPQFMVARINETFEVHDEIRQESIVLQRDSVGSRLIFWTAGFKMFLAHPLSGVGFQQFPYWLPYYAKELGVSSMRPAHSMYIKILAEQGIFGFLLFFWMLYRAFRMGLQLNNNNKDPFIQDLYIASSVILIGLMVAMFFGDRFAAGVQVGHFFMFYAVIRNILQWQNPSQVVQKYKS